ncbi:bestrophin protein [Ceratobasidium sp. AG-Ba]|nr:bestrophin protein [Ceratobasidium sp. AG-Ba]
MPVQSAVPGGIFVLKKLRGVVVNEIWPEMTFFTAVAAMVVCVSKYTSAKLSISPQLLTVLGTVLGLVISFRTTSAYDRYWEGRKLWTTISLSSRNLANIIWIHVPTDRSAKAKSPLPKDAKLRAIIEKKSMINVVQAFSAAVKHYLRGESGVYYQDVYPLIAFLPQYAAESAQGDPDTRLPLWSDVTNSGGYHIPREEGLDELPKGAFGRKKRKDFDPEKALPDVTPDHVHLAPARLPPQEGFFDYFPIFMPLRGLYKLLKRTAQKLDDDDDGRQIQRSVWTGKKIQRPVVESVVPLELALYLSSYFNFLLTEGLLQSATATGFNNNLNSLQDAAVQLRRVATTPIPFAYQAHLRMAVWLYLLFLPFQVYSSLNWVTIPATLFAAFLYLGFLEIGAEIENPFMYDENDLDIDSYCLNIARELAEITAHNPAPPSEYIFSPLNQPFAPSDRRTAQDLTTDMEHEYYNEASGMDSVRATLVRSWRSVNQMTSDNKKRRVAA